MWSCHMGGVQSPLTAAHAAVVNTILLFLALAARVVDFLLKIRRGYLRTSIMPEEQQWQIYSS